MRATALGPCGRNTPQPRCKIELAPRGAGDFALALPREDQEPHCGDRHGVGHASLGSPSARHTSTSCPNAARLLAFSASRQNRHASGARYSHRRPIRAIRRTAKGAWRWSIFPRPEALRNALPLTSGNVLQCRNHVLPRYVTNPQIAHDCDESIEPIADRARTFLSINVLPHESLDHFPKGWLGGRQPQLRRQPLPWRLRVPPLDHGHRGEVPSMLPRRIALGRAIAGRYRQAHRRFRPCFPFGS